MRTREQFWRWCALNMALSAAGCGGSAAAPPPPDPAALAAATQESAAPFIVPMSMVIPKKTSAPATTTTASTTTPPPAQFPAGTGFPTTPPGGATPGGAAPANIPGAGAAGAAAMTGMLPASGAAGAPAAPAMMAAAAGAAAPAGDNISGVPDAELEMLRQTCVDEINMYRATLTDRMLKPITRATPEQEACSDKGAQMDGDSMQAHGSAKAGLCSSVGLGAEDTCPGWPVGGGWGGNATVADALKSCLQQMWAEGEPPVSRQECQQDYQGCFLKYGHYLNMSDPNITSAACSFYKMKDGRSYWMNQDFTVNFGGWGRM